MTEPAPRRQFGFDRTRCDCELCRAPCRHIPGSLAIGDLERLCPPGADTFAWAEEHLRAITDKPFPTLVPARQANGHCHWLFQGLCAVHENAPYGCAFFDSHMPPAEAERRSAATIQARLADAKENGLHYRVWQHLRSKGLIVRSGDRATLAVERQQIRRQGESHRRRQEMS
jgi:hypothetical protein